jgi:pimeloyl-ACP methyl ester carboxylesterase
MPSMLQVPLYPLAAVGLAALALGAMLAVPLERPPTMASIETGAHAIDHTGVPELTHYQARDATWLAYRLYPAAGADTGRVAILAHGSSAQSVEMNPIAKALAAAGVTAVALDVRGHGASAARGDIGYAGQLEDDLADLLAVLRQDRPDARFALIGHSLGGGFVARISSTPVGRSFDRFVLVAPFLGPNAPSSGDGNKQWARVDLPRILALNVLSFFGVTLGEHMPVIAFANNPAAAKNVTSVYSYRLLADYGPDFDWPKTKAALAAAAAKTAVVAGADDELMLAAAYERELKPLGVAVTVLPHVNHMGTVNDPAALAALVAAVKGG